MDEMVKQEREAGNVLDRIALLIAELQRDVMEQGKALGGVMQHVQKLDRACGVKFTEIDKLLKGGNDAVNKEGTKNKEGNGQDVR